MNSMPIPSTSSIRQKLSNRSLLLIFGVLFVVSQSVILYITAPLGSDKLLQLQTTFSVTTFQEIIAEWRAYDILHLYFQHYYFDLFLHPIFYSVLLAVALSMSMDIAKMNNRYNFVLYLPFIAGLGDILENGMHLLMLTNSNLINAFTVGISAFFTNGKWLLCGISLLLIVYFLIKAIRKS